MPFRLNMPHTIHAMDKRTQQNAAWVEAADEGQRLLPRSAAAAAEQPAGRLVARPAAAGQGLTPSHATKPRRGSAVA
jgi:hypothetical protein